MRAMVLEKMGSPLVLKEVPSPIPKQNEVEIEVLACAVCRTDLHIVDGELPAPQLPLILGHQIVGRVKSPHSKFQQGDLVGVPWLGKSCGHCYYCTQKQENLCDTPTFTGYTVNGGFAEVVVAHEDYIFPIPKGYDPIQAAPLLCAGMIGYRSLQKVRDAKTIGFYGFGSAAHLLIQVAKHRNQKIYAFTKEGDTKGQKEAMQRGATWAGSSTEMPPEPLDGAIIFAPVGSLIPQALRALRKGGKVVCAGIHMSDIPSFPYDILWGERSIESVANLTRKDGEEFLTLAPKIPIVTEVTTYPLEKANEALDDLREGRISETAVITI
ncbi:MAG: putative alcohol dehydrogenase AdhA [Chlamydiae bacterium]|nr:putative alcohol dehydrogenase AdhA [Chlamydiota bacterium]